MHPTACCYAEVLEKIWVREAAQHFHSPLYPCIAPFFSEEIPQRFRNTNIVQGHWGSVSKFWLSQRRKSETEKEEYPEDTTTNLNLSTGGSGENLLVLFISHLSMAHTGMDSHFHSLIWFRPEQYAP